MGIIGVGGQVNFKVVAISCEASTIKELVKMGADLYISITDEGISVILFDSRGETMARPKRRTLRGQVSIFSSSSKLTRR